MPDMPEQKPQTEQPKAQDASKIATQMRTKGMNTVQIMRALFEASNQLQLVGAKTGSLNQAIAADITAASVKQDLSTTVDASIKAIKTAIGATKNNIDSLRTVRTAAAVADTFDKDLQPIEGNIKEMEQMVEEYKKSTNQLIGDLHETCQKLAENPNDGNAKLKLEEVSQQLQQQSERVKKQLMGESMRTIHNRVFTLGETIAQTTSATTGAAAQVPKPGQN